MIYIGTFVSILALTTLRMPYTATHPGSPKHKPPAGCAVNTVFIVCCFPADDKETL